MVVSRLVGGWWLSQNVTRMGSDSEGFLGVYVTNLTRPGITMHNTWIICKRSLPTHYAEHNEMGSAVMTGFVNDAHEFGAVINVTRLSYSGEPLGVWGRVGGRICCPVRHSVRPGV